MAKPTKLTPLEMFDAMRDLDHALLEHRGVEISP